MKTVLLLRHAKSSWSDGALPDHERPLNERGQQAAPQMGRLLARLQLVPDLILTSTAVRARDTAELVARHSAYQGRLEPRSELYHASPQRCLAVLRDLPNLYTSVMLVAHNPGLEEVVSRISGDEQHFPTAALAQVELPIHSWSEFSDWRQGKLINIWRPRELEADT